jgi:hypothetical protein
MGFHGFEVDMLSVGNADCILATRHDGPSNTWHCVLIDGGNKGGAEILKAHLAQRKITTINSVVCTHPHDDHAAGLLELLKDKTIAIESAYMHIPHWHVDVGAVRKNLGGLAGSPEADNIRKSLSTVEELYAAFESRKIPIIEPFAGTSVQSLTVVGPSQSYYEELVGTFADIETVKDIDKKDALYKFWSALHDQALGELETDLPPDPITTPENNSSVILAAAQDNQKYLFTADAGVPALQKAAEQYKLAGCHWMQIPHHGSRRNINPALIKIFSPKHAWASAEGSKKHPRRAVVNAFKEVGTRVCSTHYPVSRNLWTYTGSVPQRTGYTPFVPLYEAKTLSKSSAPVTFENPLLRPSKW